MVTYFGILHCAGTREDQRKVEGRVCALLQLRFCRAAKWWPETHSVGAASRPPWPGAALIHLGAWTGPSDNPSPYVHYFYRLPEVL